MPKYRVVIPYDHEFIVEADSPEEALDKAHSQSGRIIGFDDDNAMVEEQS